MPTAPPRACHACGAARPAGEACDCATARATRRVHDTHRGTRQSRGYSNAWVAYARTFRDRFPYCGQRADGTFSSEHSQCWRAGRRVHGDCVDHIVPLRDGGALLDPSNHQTLCTRCNTEKG